MYLLEKAGANLTQVGLFLVVLPLQILQERPLEFVDVLDVAEDSFELRVCEHPRVFATLADVTLQKSVSRNKNQEQVTSPHKELLL